MHTILLAEDSEDEVFFFTRALREIQTPCSLQVALNGAGAIDYLAGAGVFVDREQFPMPDFLLLDINLPLLSGWEVLQWIRNDSSLKDLPVAILTHFDHPACVDRARTLGADAYFIKPAGQQQLGELLRNITRSWLKCGAFPNALP